ncbi:hypothetical protein N9H93_04330 [Rhizobiaceae bacterium]|nr:hypothetical protein [Rhizobiaceae bacterium]
MNGLLTLRGQRMRALRLGTDADATDNIAAIDRVLVNVIGNTGDTAGESKDFRRVALFGRGEVRRLVGEILRGAKRPLTTLQIAQQALVTKSVAVSCSRRVKGRVSNVWKVLADMHGVVRGADANGNVVGSRAT